MRYALALEIALLVILLTDVVTAQTQQDCLITLNADGTCKAAGLYAPCSQIGPKLRLAGIPADAHIRFGCHGKVTYDVVSATLRSVAQAGFTSAKIGFVNTEPAR